MNGLTNKAIDQFRSGLNCAQAVLNAYTDHFKVDKTMAMSIACGFGGGMGRLQGTCGAVTGAFMVMGLHNCQKYTDTKERKEKTYTMIQEFDRRFRNINGTLDCRELLKVDLKTEEGHQYWKENNLSEKVCEKCIGDAIKIMEEIMV
jgi:C_GCAxxG_C_C family probable redox protein